MMLYDPNSKRRPSMPTLDARRDTASDLLETPYHVDVILDDAKYTLQQENAERAYQRQSPVRKVLLGLVYVALALVSLYFFMVAVKLIGSGLTLALGCGYKGAFDFTNNPIAGLMIGTMATALIHSSGTVTSITVALVGTGGMTIRQAVPVVMGANIGTCVTCILVAFAQVGDPRRFERAMAAATVHDMYNIWSVLVMFPIEVIAHPLEKLSVALSKAHTVGGAFASPVDTIVNPLADFFIEVNEKGIYKVATGEAACEDYASFLAGGMFHGAKLSDGAVGGLVAGMGFLFLLLALLALVRMMSKVFLGPTKRAVARALEYNGYLNILLGAVLTFSVHSSTLVTSTLTPMAGLGVLTLNQVYPLAIGANLGTTTTALLASLVTGKSDSVAIALVHFWFNFFGIFLFYPVPITREPILNGAMAIARWSAAWPMAAVIFILVCFGAFPGVALGITYLCTAKSVAAQVVGWLLVALVGLLLVGFYGWYKRFGGQPRWEHFLETKLEERLAREQQRLDAEPEQSLDRDMTVLGDESHRSRAVY